MFPPGPPIPGATAGPGAAAFPAAAAAAAAAGGIYPFGQLPQSMAMANPGMGAGVSLPMAMTGATNHAATILAQTSLHASGKCMWIFFLLAMY